jgi:hypothetical protein
MEAFESKYDGDATSEAKMVAKIKSKKRERQGLKLVCFSAEPEPFRSGSRFVSTF